MPDYFSRKNLKKKATNRLVNEGGRTAAENRKKQIEEPPRKRKVRKNKRS